MESLWSRREHNGACERQNKKLANEDYQGPIPEEILIPP
jgi:hypothetical protein